MVEAQIKESLAAKAQENEFWNHPDYKIVNSLMAVSELVMCNDNYALNHPQEVLDAINLAGNIDAS